MLLARFIDQLRFCQQQTIR